MTTNEILLELIRRLQDFGIQAELSDLATQVEHEIYIAKRISESVAIRRLTNEDKGDHQ
jgi:hypothetical protein